MTSPFLSRTLAMISRRRSFGARDSRSLVLHCVFAPLRYMPKDP